MLRFKIFLLFCALGGLKEENTGVGMSWYSFNLPITTEKQGMPSFRAGTCSCL